MGTNFWLRLLFGWIKFLESKKKKKIKKKERKHFRQSIPLCLVDSKSTLYQMRGEWNWSCEYYSWKERFNFLPIKIYYLHKHRKKGEGQKCHHIEYLFILFGKIFINIIFFIHSSISGHLGCFHVFTVTNDVAVNMDVQKAFQISVFGSVS